MNEMKGCSPEDLQGAPDSPCARNSASAMGLGMGWGGRKVSGVSLMTLCTVDTPCLTLLRVQQSLPLPSAWRTIGGNPGSSVVPCELLP